jgi:hypothetical protein
MNRIVIAELERAADAVPAAEDAPPRSPAAS